MEENSDVDVWREVLSAKMWVMVVVERSVTIDVLVIVARVVRGRRETRRAEVSIVVVVLR